MAGSDLAQQGKWQVVGVNPSVDVATGGIPVKGNIVTFVTALGHRGQVFVPDSVPNLDAARDIVAKQVAHVDGLGTLTG